MELDQASILNNPSLKVDDEQTRQRFNHNLEEIELVSVDQCNTVQVMDDLQLVGAPADTSINGAVVEIRGEGGMVDVEAKFAEAETAAGKGRGRGKGKGKRKRGRPPGSGQVKIRRSNPPPVKRKKDEEDVCFICFDGGSLVLCDRKGCPKAYHKTCIKRDEAFFQSKAKWTCGWHLCRTCHKASYYMCYTCTYSLCKGCTKDADYFSVRGNKGFCGVCLRTIMLIENCAPGEKVEVDFDDQTSFEYLFKVYWVCLKEKLSLTINELTQARNPWKKPTTTAQKGKCSSEVDGANCTKGPSSEIFCGDLEPNRFPIQERSSVVHAVTEVVDVVKSQVEAYENYDNQLVMGNDKSCKISKEADKRGSLANPDEYAATDVHNINLMYLKRCLMENLFVEDDKFHDKVVGSISQQLCSSSDLQVHSHSTVTDESFGVSQADVFDVCKSSGGPSSTSAEVEGDTKPSDDSINQCKVGSKIQAPLPPVMSWEIDAMDTWKLGSETANINQGTVQGNANLAFGGLGQGIKDVGLGTDQWTAQDYVNLNMDTSIGNPGIWESQPRYVGDSLSGPRDHDFSGGDSSFERGKLVWNGSEICDVGNGEGRFCKFYANGCCKKGASCGFWHT